MQPAHTRDSLFKRFGQSNFDELSKPNGQINCLKALYYKEIMNAKPEDNQREKNEIVENHKNAKSEKNKKLKNSGNLSHQKKVRENKEKAAQRIGQYIDFNDLPPEEVEEIKARLRKIKKREKQKARRKKASKEKWLLKQKDLKEDTTKQNKDLKANDFKK